MTYLETNLEDIEGLAEEPGYTSRQATSQHGLPRCLR